MEYIARKANLFFLLRIVLVGSAFVGQLAIGDDSAPNPPPEADVLQAYERVLSLGLFRTDFPAYILPVPPPRYAGVQKPTKAWLAIVHGPVNMEFELPQMRLRFASNRALYRYLATLPADRKEEPRWTPEEAVAKAREYVEAFERPDWRNFKLSRRPPYFCNEGLEAGRWEVAWDRVAGQYRYPEDGIIVTLHERFGLFTYGVALYSSAVSTNVKLIKEEGVHIGNDVIAASQKKWLRHLPKVNLKLRNAALEIVHPNWIFTDRVSPDDPYKFLDNRDARVAWVVEYAAGDDTSSPKVWVWVDARSGEVLGGDWEKGI